MAALTDDNIKALADGMLGAEMVDLGFAGVDVEHRDVYDDGPSLYIGVNVGENVPAPFDGQRFEKIRRRLHDALLDRGEERFPHVILKRAGDEAPEPDHIPVDP